MGYIPFNSSVVQGDGGDPEEFVWEENGSPIDITTWVIYYTAKTSKDVTDANASISYDSVNDPTIIVKSDSGSGTTDKFTITLAATDTDDLTAGIYYQDIQRIISSGDPWTLGMGKLTVEGDVTRRTTT